MIMYVTFVYYLFVTISKRNAMLLIRNEATNIFFFSLFTRYDKFQAKSNLSKFTRERG